MKLIIALCLLLTAQMCFAKEYQLGFVLGAPTGISGKMEMGGNRSVDAVLAYSLYRHQNLVFHSDYLVEKAHSYDVHATSPLDLYYGIGVRMGFIDGGKHDGDLAIGPRAPIGVNFKVQNPNLELFGEVAAALDLAPETNFDVEAGLGIRYRF